MDSRSTMVLRSTLVMTWAFRLGSWRMLTPLLVSLPVAPLLLRPYLFALLTGLASQALASSAERRAK